MFSPCLCFYESTRKALVKTLLESLSLSKAAGTEFAHALENLLQPVEAELVSTERNRVRRDSVFTQLQLKHNEILVDHLRIPTLDARGGGNSLQPPQDSFAQGIGRKVRG